MRIPMRIMCVRERDCGWLSGRGIRREGRLLEKDSEFETTRDWEREGNVHTNHSHIHYKISISTPFQHVLHFNVQYTGLEW